VHIPRSTGSGAVFRPEIEGLRAVAAILVATFHIWLGRVSGGVDVFFVVSGFLITTGLLSQIDRHGAPQFAVFWGRLINRLLPPALLVLGAVVVASIFLLPMSRWSETIKQVAASAIYVENWLLASSSVDYLQQGEPVSPVQHYWALSAQGQFYLLWPLLFAAFALVARRMKIDLRRLAAVGLFLVCALSLAYSVWLTQRNQPVAYFVTTTRVWEFAVGGLLAIFITRITLPPYARLLAGWVGLVAILSCGLVLQVSRVFPGYAALWPVLGGALVILAGTSSSRLGVDRFLGSAPMIYLGGISYCIYLWHFPILELYRTHTTPGPVDLLPGSCIVAATLVLAALTHRFVEVPVKRAKIGSVAPWRAYAFGALCSAPIVIGLALWSALYFQGRSHEQRIVTVDNPDYPGARALDPNFASRSDSAVEIYPGPHIVDFDFERLGDACGRPSDDGPRECTVVAGEPGRPTIAVVGGSHSAQWLPALQDIAAREGWRIVSYTKHNCAFYLGEDRVNETEWSGCNAWNRQVLELVRRLKPEAVFLASTRMDDRGDYIPDSYVAAWRALGDAGINVIAVRVNPRFKIALPDGSYASLEVSDCVELHGQDAPECTRTRAETIASPSPTELLVNPPHTVHFIDLTDYFCPETLCLPVIGNVMVYRSGAHITGTYARSLARPLQDAIEAGGDLYAPAVRSSTAPPARTRSAFR
jgi:peptidoglycan/LPS O-acetylase OafA/YrhL